MLELVLELLVGFRGGRRSLLKNNHNNNKNTSENKTKQSVWRKKRMINSHAWFAVSPVMGFGKESPLRMHSTPPFKPYQ